MRSLLGVPFDTIHIVLFFCSFLKPHSKIHSVSTSKKLFKDLTEGLTSSVKILTWTNLQLGYLRETKNILSSVLVSIYK